MNRSPVFLAWFLLILLTLIWGSSFILIKIGLRSFSGGEVGALRIILASIFLLPLSLPRIKHITKRQWLLLGTIGMFGSLFPSFLFAIAQTQIPSSIAGILNALTPLFTLLIGIILFQQRTNMQTLTGIFIGLIGCIVLILAGQQPGLKSVSWYALLVVAATIFYGANLNIIKFKIHDLTSRTISSISLLIVGPAALVYLLAFTPFLENVQKPQSLTSFGAVAVLGIVGTAIALIIFNQLVKITSPVFTSSVTYLIPLVAVSWGLLDGERLLPGHYLGLALIIFGVYLSTYRQRARAKALENATLK
jgi:drug/metabolite transporter (DMT)-like permease